VTMQGNRITHKSEILAVAPCQHSGAAGGRVRLGRMSTGAYPSPLRHFLADLDKLPHPTWTKSGGCWWAGRRRGVFHSADRTDPRRVSPDAVADQARTGSRLVLVHRPEGVMVYTHSHQCWVAIAPVCGVETHQHWDALRGRGWRASP
jgi:hypothetical protein